MLTNPKNREIGNVMLSSMTRDHLAFQYPGLFKPGMGKWLDFGTWFMPNVFNDIMGYLNSGIESTMRRIESPPEDADQRKDIRSYLINARDPDTGEGIDKSEISGEACILHLSGASTIAGVLSLLFFYLSRPTNVKACEKLAQELRSRFSSSSEITLEELEQCVYLNATTFEALHFTSGHAFWRDALPGGAVITIPSSSLKDSDSVQTHIIPPGYTAGFCDFSTSRTSSIYPDADTFDPDRWIPTSTFYTARSYTPEDAQQIYERGKNATRAFGVGQRACIAEHLAKALLLLAVGNIVWRSDVKKAEGPDGDLGGGGIGMGRSREKKDEFQWYGSFTLAGDGPMIQLKEV